MLVFNKAYMSFDFPKIRSHTYTSPENKNFEFQTMSVSVVNVTILSWKIKN